MATGDPVTGLLAEILTSDPRLGPLDDYGGPTRTFALLPGSAARDVASLSQSLPDQRVFS